MENQNENNESDESGDIVKEADTAKIEKKPEGYFEQDENTDSTTEKKEDEAWKTEIAELKEQTKTTQEMIVALTAQQAALSESTTGLIESMTQAMQSQKSAGSQTENPQEPKPEAKAEPKTEAEPEKEPEPAAVEGPKAGRKKARKASWI